MHKKEHKIQQSKKKYLRDWAVLKGIEFLFSIKSKIIFNVS